MAAISASLAVLPAAWRKSPALPGLLLSAALTQAICWGGAWHTLDLADRVFPRVEAELEKERVRVRTTEPSEPEWIQEMSTFLRYPREVGRPAARQLGWLLLAPWVFVPAIWWVSRRREPETPGAPSPHGP